MAQHEAGVDVGDIAGAQHTVEQEAREVVEILDHDLQQIVHVAGKRVTGHHLIPVGDTADETLDAGGVVPGQLQANEGLQPVAQTLWIKHGAVAGNEALGFQSLHSAQTGRG
jgi:hypothetical protein